MERFARGQLISAIQHWRYQRKIQMRLEVVRLQVAFDIYPRIQRLTDDDLWLNLPFRLGSLLCRKFQPHFIRSFLQINRQMDDMIAGV